jgi:hypothetical protein
LADIDEDAVGNEDFDSVVDPAEPRDEAEDDEPLFGVPAEDWEVVEAAGFLDDAADLGDGASEHSADDDDDDKDDDGQGLQSCMLLGKWGMES